MKSAIIFLITCLICQAAHGQLPPQIEPHAKKYDQERASTEASRDTQLKPARDRYLAALAEAQKTAAAAARSADMAAIAAEIQQVQGGTLGVQSPPDLPRGLSADRRAYSSAREAIDKSVTTKLRELAQRYLQGLAIVEQRATQAKDTALAAAAASERLRVLPHLDTAGGGQRRRNLIENGDFSAGTPGNWPPGWKPNVDWRRADDATLVQEGDERFLRFRRLTALRQADLMTEKTLNVPEGAKGAEFSLRMRAEGLVAGKEYETYPCLKLTVWDAAGTRIADARVEVRQNTGWKRFSGRCEVPNGAKTLRVEFGPFGASGVIDFDDVEVEFK